MKTIQWQIQKRNVISAKREKKIVPYFCILTLSMGFALGILFLWVEKGRERIFVVKAFEL